MSEVGIYWYQKLMRKQRRDILKAYKRAYPQRKLLIDRYRTRRFSPLQVEIIRDLKRCGFTYKQLMKLYKCDREILQKVVNGYSPYDEL